MKKISLLSILVILMASCSKTTKSESSSSSLMSTSNESSTTSEISNVEPDSSSSIVSSNSIELSSSSEASSDISSSEISSSESSSSSVASSSSERSSLSSSSNASSASSVSSSSEQSSSQESFPPEPVGVVKKTVTFLNGNFTNSSLDQATSQKQFISWFNNGDDVLESINYSGYAQLNYIGNEGDSNRFSTLILGSQKSNGSITFNLKYYPTMVKFVVQPYTKYIAYNSTYNVDTNATFIVNQEEYDLSLEEGYSGETETQTVYWANKTESNSFTIANKEAGQRVFVHSLEITYYG